MVSVQSVNNSQPTFKGRKVVNLAEEAVKSFKAAGKKMTQADKDYLAKQITKQKVDAELPKAAGMYNFLSKHDGEIQNQLLNAVFTSTLAPTMIYVNPFVKKTPEQKLKTAMRQPVSAGIACSFSLGATLLINKIMEHGANSGYIPSQDLRMNPSEALLKKNFKKQLKQARKAGTEAEFLSKYTPEHIEMAKFIEGQKKFKFQQKAGIENAYFEKFAEVQTKNRKEIFEKLMKADVKDIHYIEEEGKTTIKVGKETLKNIEDIPNMTKKSIEKFVKKFNIHNVEGLDAKDSKAVSNYIENTFKNVSDNFKNFKKMVNPVIGIPVAVVACCILNAVYPPFRDKFAPPLMKLFGIEPAKKEVAVEGGNK